MSDRMPQTPEEWDAHRRQEVVAQMLHSLRQNLALLHYVRELERELAAVREENARLRGLGSKPASESAS